MQPQKIGGLSYNGAVPKTLNTNPNQSLGGISSPTTNSRTAGMGLSVGTGNNPGLINQPTTPKPDTTYTHSTNTNQTGGTSTKPTPNPSVLAQQQAMNKLGAGLVEDGLAGPLTQEAISSGKYTGTGTPVKTETAPAKTETKVTPTEYSSSNPANFSGLINQGANVSGNAANTGATNYGTANTGLINSLGQNQVLSDRAQEIANTAGQTMSDIGRKGAMGQAGYRTTGTSPVGEGNAAVLAQTTAAQQNAVAQGANMELQGTQQGLTAQGQTQSGFNNAGSMGLQGQGQGISGLGNVAGQIAPIQQPYSNMLINPTTGQPYSQTGGTLQDAVSGVVQKLTSGQMTYNDALSALSGYGQGGVNALQQALPPEFNIAQSNTLSGQQGSIGVNYQLADTALKNVESKLQDLMSLQKTNIPLVNSATNWISTTFGKGSEQTRAMTGAVQSLRNAYGSLLASVKGGTPTDYSSQAAAEIPNEPTPNDIKAIRDNFEVLGKARANILGNPGQSGGTSGSTTGGGIWDF